MDIITSISEDIYKAACYKLAELNKAASGGLPNPGAASKVSKGLSKSLGKIKPPTMSMPSQNIGVSTAVTNVTNGLPTFNSMNASQQTTSNFINNNLNKTGNQAGMFNQAVLPMNG